MKPTQPADAHTCYEAPEQSRLDENGKSKDAASDVDIPAWTLQFACRRFGLSLYLEANPHRMETAVEMHEARHHHGSR